MKNSRLGALTIALAVVALAVPATHGRTTFDPRVEMAYGYTDNLGLGGDGEEVDDQMSILDLLLKGQTKWDKGTFDYFYRPTLLRYQTQEELDRDEHRLDLTLDTRFSRKVEMDLRLRGISTQVQGDAGSDDDSELFLGQRTDRQIYTGSALFRFRLSRLWTLGTSVAARLEKFDEIEGYTDPGSGPEDRDTYSGAFEFNRDVSDSSDVGLRFLHRTFELEGAGDSESSTVMVTYTREVGRKIDLKVGAGGYDLRGIDDNVSVNKQGFQGFVNLTRTYEKVLLRLIARQEPTSGGSLNGTSVNTQVGLNVTSRGKGVLYWRVAPRYAYRDPTDDADRPRDTFAVRVEFGVRFSKKLGLMLRTNYIDQEIDSDGADTKSVFHANFGLVWSPWGGTSVAGR